MDPLPLKSPDGRIYAYICGNCHYVYVGASKLGKQDGPDEAIVEMASNMAQRCCRCHDCSKALFDPMKMRCGECEAKHERETSKWMEEREAENARRDEENGKVLRETGGDKGAAMLLLDIMSDISEEYYCAGWLVDLEYMLWHAVETEERSFGFGEIPNHQIEAMKEYASACGAWWVFSEEFKGNILVPLDEWRKIYESHERKTRESRNEG